MKQAEEYKQELYSQLKSLDKSQVRNTIHEEQKYSFQKILLYLNHKTTDKKCIVSIGNTNFTFLKK